MKKIALTLAGLGLTGVLMAGGPWGAPGEPWGDRAHRGMHQPGDRPDGRMHRRHARGERRGMVRRLARELDLTRTQREKLRAIFAQQRQTARAKRRAHAAPVARPDMAQFMTAEHFDKDAFVRTMQAQAAKRKAKRQALRKARLEARAGMMAEIFDILTPAQRQKWIELSKQHTKER